ncbi:MAG: hypothetical protein POG74_10055 [Acidocella sp.]|nr:hypothetical protein [Acidocella sp.]
MKTLGMMAAVLIWGLLAVVPAFADNDQPPPPPPTPAAPAPMLAAGIPAFIAVGGGAALVRLLRRRR